MLRKFRLELLLILSVMLLVGQIAWPAVARWWRRPLPGRTGIDQCEIVGVGQEYLVYLPQEYGVGSLPLLVFLHGAGERGSDATVLHGHGPLSFVQHATKFPAVIAAPQCVSDSEWQPDSVAQFVEQIADRYRVDRGRIYLIGYSMGGYGTWRTACVHPELFAAIVPISGGGDPIEAKALVGMPVWAFHGAKDETVPVAESEQMVDAIRGAGGHPKLTVIHDGGHGICEDVCRKDDLWQWILEQHSNQ